MRIKIVRALLWMIRRFSFSVVLNDNAVTVYQWEQSRVTGLRDWFESPNVAGELDRESVSTVLQREGLGWLAWQILTNSELQARRLNVADEPSDDFTLTMRFTSSAPRMLPGRAETHSQSAERCTMDVQLPQ